MRRQICRCRWTRPGALRRLRPVLTALLVAAGLPVAVAAQVQVTVNDQTTLAAAITTANGDTANDYEILLAADIVLTSALPTINTTITIRPSPTAPSGNRIERSTSSGAFRLFRVGSVSGVEGHLTVEDLTLANGRVVGAPAQGGAIELLSASVSVPKARLTVTRSTFLDNMAVGTGSGGHANGGAIWAGGDTFLTVTDCHFEGNKALGQDYAFGGGSGHGGAIYITRLGLGQTSVTNISGTTFLRNEVRGGSNGSSTGGFARGGAIRALESKIGLNGGNEFIENLAVGGSGGGAFSRAGEGGAIFIADPEATANQTITGDRFLGNVARGGNGQSGRGGAIFIEFTSSGVGGPVTLTDVEVRDNQTLSSSGATSGEGGGIYLGGSPDLTATRLALIDNEAGSGGGLYKSAGSTAFVDSCIVSNTDVAYFASSGTQVGDNVWWGDPSGPSGTGLSGSGDSVSPAVTINSWLTAPPAGVACDASVAYDCSSVTISDGAGMDEMLLEFTTAAAGFDSLSFIDGTDVSFVGVSPAGCDTSGSDMTCTATVTLTAPGSGTESAAFVVATPSEGPTTCTFTSADGLPVDLESFWIE